MQLNGYIYIHKQLLSTSFYRDSYAVHLALHLLLKANYQDTRITFNGKEMTIHRGQHLTGRKRLSEETGINQSTITHKLKLLEQTHFLNIKTNNRFSVITICKYEDFQNIKNKKEQQVEQPVNNQRTTSEQPVNTPNEVKEVKEVKEKTTPLPPKGGMKVVGGETVSDSKTALPETKTPIVGKTESLIGSLYIKNVLLEFKTVYPRINGKFPQEQEVLRRLNWWPSEDIPNILLAAKNYAVSERVLKGVGIKDPANFVDLPHNPHPFWKDWLVPEKPPPPKGLTRSIGATPNMLILAEMIAAEEKEKNGRDKIQEADSAAGSRIPPHT